MTADRVTLADLREAAAAGRKRAMLTCYDFTTAAALQDAGVPILLVGDSAANVILGHDSTARVSLDFLTTLTDAVRRGAPRCFVMADLPLGSYHGSAGRAVENACGVVSATGCDAVKVEVVDAQAPLVRRMGEAGLAVCAHLGLRPQSVQKHGYRAQGRTPEGAAAIVDSAGRFADAGAELILLEAVPPEVGERVVAAVDVPVIGCGAGPAPAAHVVVLHDLLGLTGRTPRFVPKLPPMPLADAAAEWVRLVESGEYPAAEHCYSMRNGPNGP